MEEWEYLNEKGEKNLYYLNIDQRNLERLFLICFKMMQYGIVTPSFRM